MLRRRALALGLSLASLAPMAASAVTPTVAHAATNVRPVILVHGFLGAGWNWEIFKARLQADGFNNVFTIDLANFATGTTPALAGQLKAKVDQVLAQTGASQVDIIGHSKGGLVSRYYMKTLGGHPKVAHYVSLGTPQYGTIAGNLAAMFGCAGLPACAEMTTNSAFLTALNAGDDTPGNTKYTAIYTVMDELVQPYFNARLEDGAVNIKLQAKCPLRIVGHLGLIVDGTVYGLAKKAILDQGTTANCFAL